MCLGAERQQAEAVQFSIHNDRALLILEDLITVNISGLFVYVESVDYVWFVVREKLISYVGEDSYDSVG